jgi:acyl-CoA reductase-like NAD-dependent aldehyde dehydrogenase
MSTLQSFNARTGQAYGAALPATTTAELHTAIDKAGDAFDGWQASDGASRANLLNALAAALEQDREKLVELADAETGLGLPRLNGELDRTAFQLRRFATIAQSGGAFAFTDDPAVAGAPPAGHPAMMRVRVPLGPVAMFSASNFPFAFSVLGGDTASALAAGCSVVVKAHSGHLHTSARVYQLARQTLAALGLHEGLIQMVQGAGSQVGVALVQHPTIASGAFTGSTRGGAALRDAARSRPRPIPFYGELGSINPVIATPEALQKGGDALVQTLAGSITLGCGQFCTNPGLLVLQRSPESQTFVAALTEALKAIQPHAMLTQGMRQALDAGTAKQLAAGAKALLNNPVPDICPKPFLAEVDAATFMADHQLQEEVFGPASLIVWTDSVQQTLQVLQTVGGTLTVTFWGADKDTPEVRRLVRGATAIAGRVLFAGVPTGVAVTAAQQHGGPWPSSTEPMTTSVGDAAMDRFLRPVSLQDMPAWLVQRQGRPC